MRCTAGLLKQQGIIPQISKIILLMRKWHFVDRMMEYQKREGSLFLSLHSYIHLFGNRFNFPPPAGGIFQINLSQVSGNVLDTQRMRGGNTQSNEEICFTYLPLGGKIHKVIHVLPDRTELIWICEWKHYHSEPRLMRSKHRDWLQTIRDYLGEHADVTRQMTGEGSDPCASDLGWY